MKFTRSCYPLMALFLVSCSLEAEPVSRPISPSANKLDRSRFSYEVKPDFKLQSASDLDTYNVNGVDIEIRRGQIALTAQDDSRIGEIVHRLNAKVLDHEFVWEDQPIISGSKLDGTLKVVPPKKKKYLPSYLLDVPVDANEDLTTFPSLADRAGVHGHYVFPSIRVAGLIKKTLELQLNYADNLKVVSANALGHGDGATLEGRLYDMSSGTLGAFEQSPDTTNFWWTRTYTSGNPKGCNINDIANWQKLFDYSTGAGVKVAVIDSGFQGSAEAQTPRQVILYGETEYNAITGAPDVTGATTATGTTPWHGRAVASLIFAPYGDTGGTLGTAQDAWPYIVHTDYSDYYDKKGVDQCITWGVKVVNMSFNGPSFPQLQNSVYNGINYHSMIFVASTGNTGDQVSYPCSFDGVIGVGATDQNGNKSYFPNLGYSNTIGLDIWAPGTNIAAASWPNQESGQDPNWFLSWSGTSFATPLVTGVIACAVQKGYCSNAATALTRVQSKGHQWNSVSGKNLDAITTVKAP